MCLGENLCFLSPLIYTMSTARGAELGLFGGSKKKTTQHKTVLLSINMKACVIYRLLLKYQKEN